ncbi:MAG: hypothetical protein KAX44_05645, partial [Candidatus Brocadiae bacterium]|nr:hypothetical protein [Candidatus Brocadiia bacterium]
MRNWIAVLGLLSIAVATAAEEVNVRLTDVPRQVRLPLPDGENAILTAPVDGKVRSLWLARSLDARARYLLDRVGEGVYQVNLADPVLAAMLEASGAGQVRVFAEAPDGTVSASIPVSYAVRTSAREWHRPPRVFVHTEEKTTELSWWARGWDPDRLALLAEIRGQGMAITAPDLSGLPFGPGGKDITGWFEPSEVKLIEVRFDPGADRTSARAGAGERQWEFARADSGEGRHELAVTTPVRRAWEQAGELAAPRRQPDADFFVDVYVSVGDANAADAPGRGTTSLPYKSIQYALDHSSGTETRPVAIHVAAGTYADRIVLDENDQYTSILGGYNA